MLKHHYFTPRYLFLIIAISFLGLFTINTFVMQGTKAFDLTGSDKRDTTSRGQKTFLAPSADNYVFKTKLVASDGAANHGFGAPNAIDGETAVVAGGGAAYVFTRSGSTWVQQQKLTPSDGGLFGSSVAIDGDTVIVGRHIGGAGSAYIFVRSGSTWTEQQKITAADGVAGDAFGSAVSISGETVVIAGPGSSSGLGAVYVFVRSGGVWSQQQKLTASDGVAGDGFSAVDIDGNTVIVGANSDDLGPNTDEGSAYIFVRSGTTWTEQQKIDASDGTPGSLFGNGVAISGESVIVGAPFWGVTSETGAAYVFTRSGAVWTQQQKLIATDGEDFDIFGWSVDISGNRAVAGSDEDMVGANPSQGSAHIFIRSGTVWNAGQKIVPADGAANDHFGFSVSIDGARTIASSYGDDIGANSEQGSAYVFEVLSGSTVEYVVSYTGPPVNIPDNSVAGIDIPVSVAGPPVVSGDVQLGAQACTIADVNFRFDGTPSGTSGDTGVGVTHGHVGDLVFKLTSPAGTSVTFFDRPRFLPPSVPFGCGNNNIAGVTLDDDAGTAPVDDTCTGAGGGNTNSPFPTGTFLPDQPFSPFDGQNAVGTWVLNAADVDATFTGAVRRFSIVFSCLVPATAAEVSVSGRVITSDGRGVTNAVVSITDPQGNIRNVMTGRLGRFMFEGVTAGQTYVVSVRSRRFAFSPRVIEVNDNVSNLDFNAENTGEPNPKR